MYLPCLFCGGDASEPDHLSRCDGRQGAWEAGLEAAPVVDAVAGRAARDEGIERVETHASPDFTDAALDAVYKVARTRYRFCTDDVWASREWWPVTRDRRAMGPVMQTAVRNRWIVATPDFVSTARKSCHAAPVRVWRSLIVSVPETVNG